MLKAATKLDISGTASPYGYIGHLAPEVITDDITDKRTDIYALGVTLYRLVNGDAYIPMVDAMELVDMIKEGTYPNRNKFRPFIPTPIKNIINKAISVDPKNRFQSASEFRHAIEKVKIYASWIPKTIQNGTEWNCKVGKMNFTIKSIRRSQGCFDLEFFKGNEGKTQKKIKDESSICDSKFKSTLQSYSLWRVNLNLLSKVTHFGEYIISIRICHTNFLRLSLALVIVSIIQI